MALTKPCAVCGTEFGKPPTVSMRVWTEERKCCSIECGHVLKRGRPNPKLGDHLRGKAQSPELVAKRSEGLKRAHAEGRMHVIDNTGLRGERTSQWKGDDIGYRAAHVRIYAQRGQPAECQLCGTHVGPFEWALRGDAVVVKVEDHGRFRDRPYSTRVDDYLAACRPCHRAYDGRERDPLTGRYL